MTQPPKPPLGVRVTLKPGKNSAGVKATVDTSAGYGPTSPVVPPPSAPPRAPTVPLAPSKPWPRSVKIALALVLFGISGMLGYHFYADWSRVTIQPERTALPGGGGSAVFRLETKRGWQIDRVGGDWLEITPANGQGNGEVKLTAKPNPAVVPREVILRIGGASHPVVQDKGAPYVRITPAAQTIEQGGGTHTIKVEANSDWRVTAKLAGSAAWFQFSPEHSSGDGAVSVVVKENATFEERVAELSVGGVTHQLTQPGKPKPKPRTAEEMSAELLPLTKEGKWREAFAGAVRWRSEYQLDLEKWKPVVASVVKALRDSLAPFDQQRPLGVPGEAKPPLAQLAELGSPEAALAAAQAHFWYRDMELLECAPADKNKIVDWLRAAARGGLPEANYHWGEFARSQQGDAVLSYRYFNQGHLARDPDSSARLAYFLLHGADEGAEEVAAKTFERYWPDRAAHGVRIAREAALKGSVRAMFYLGAHLWLTAKDASQNRQAVDWLVKAADKGHPGALQELRESVMTVKPELISDSVKTRLKLAEPL